MALAFCADDDADDDDTDDDDTDPYFDAACAACSELTEAQVEALAAYPDGGKQIFCDATCVGGDDVLHCNCEWLVRVVSLQRVCLYVRFDGEVQESMLVLAVCSASGGALFSHAVGRTHFG